MRILFSFILLQALLFGAIRHFDIYEMDGKIPGNTLLIIGGIHGDEPGGYFAPSIITQYYTIKQGSLIVVPNLNFDSIVLNRRGVYGDMNRKFDEIDPKDPDFEPVKRIKALITEPRVNFVINLHDGHGFYRDTWESAIFNPKAWGQAYIIDQKTIDDVKFGNLDEITNAMIGALNESDLANNHHEFGVKNTQTKFKDEQMQMSLTYYAITHLKPALAIETSKNIVELDTKVLYQLRSIEALMKIMEIEYERPFELNRESIQTLLNHHGTLQINDSFTLPLEDSRNALYYVPMKKDNNSFKFTHPLGAIIDRGKYQQVMIGNIPKIRLYPQEFDLNCPYNKAKVLADGVEQEVNFGTILHVKRDFKVLPTDEFRVNLIGFVTKDRDSQDGISVTKDDFIPRFSLDKNQRLFRAEFYDNGDYCGTITLAFD